MADASFMLKKYNLNIIYNILYFLIKKLLRGGQGYGD